MSKIVHGLYIFRKLLYITLCMKTFAKLVLLSNKLYFYETKEFPSLCLANICLNKSPKSYYSTL